MKQIELNIIALANSESSPENFVLILEENKGFRRLPIIIGSTEAQCIALALEKMKTNRPMTHDLIKNILERVDVSIQKVIISEMIGGVFHATLIAHKADGTVMTIDSRTSDAIAIAVRHECPIFTTEEIMEKSAVILDNPSKSFTNKRGSLSDYSIEELQRLLERVLEKEDYESATRIRDAIKKKDENS